MCTRCISSFLLMNLFSWSNMTPAYYLATACRNQTWWAIAPTTYSSCIYLHPGCTSYQHFDLCTFSARQEWTVTSTSSSLCSSRSASSIATKEDRFSASCSSSSCSSAAFPSAIQSLAMEADVILRADIKLWTRDEADVLKKGSLRCQEWALRHYSLSRIVVRYCYLYTYC